MSVSGTYSPVTYNCNGSTTEFPFAFPVMDSSGVEVTLISVAGTETVLSETTHYTVAQAGVDYSFGGAITTVETYASGYTIMIRRATDITQGGDFTQGSPTLWEAFEDGLDKAAMISQEQQEEIDRSLKFKKSSSKKDIDVPDPVALQYLRWNAFATGIENSAGPSAILNPSAYIYPEDYGATADSDHDATAAFQAMAAAAGGATAILSKGVYIITDEIQYGEGGVGFRLQGQGAGYNSSVIPTNPNGTVIVWAGDPSKMLFNLGGDNPAYVGGVFQETNDWQTSNFMRDLTIHCASGTPRLIYCHDQDNPQFRSIYVNCYDEAGVRGVFDITGTVCVPTFDNVTVIGARKGYAYRFGDATCWPIFNTVQAQRCGLGYWIGDVDHPGMAWPVTGGIFNLCSVEGTVLNGEVADITWNWDLIDGSHLAGATVLNVVDGSKFSAGKNIYIGRGDGNFEMNYIEEVNSNAITVHYPLSYNHASGEIVKVAAFIGFHFGGDYDYQCSNFELYKPMWVNVGCCVDAHSIAALKIYDPVMCAKTKRFLFLDGDIVDLKVKDYRNSVAMDSDYKVYEITDPSTWGYGSNPFRHHLWFFNWEGAVDQSGVASPYQNDQGEIDGYLNSSYIIADSPIVFNGTGLDDMSRGPTCAYDGYAPKNYRIQIDGTGASDTFKWSDDGGSTWDATGVTITGAEQSLNHGMSVIFDAVTGHTADDYWDLVTTGWMPGFRGIQTDYHGITIREGSPSAGLRYVTGDPGSEVEHLSVDPATGNMDVRGWINNLGGLTTGMGYGSGYIIMPFYASGTAPGGTASFKLETNLWAGAIMLAAALRVDVALSHNWDAAFSGGSSVAIGSNLDKAKNTKVYFPFDPNAASPVCVSETDITITRYGGGNFDAGGTVYGIVWAIGISPLEDAP